MFMLRLVCAVGVVCESSGVRCACIALVFDVCNACTWRVLVVRVGVATTHTHTPPTSAPTLTLAGWCVGASGEQHASYVC